MAEPNEMSSLVVRTGAILEVIRALSLQESTKHKSSPSLGYLMATMLITARSAKVGHEILEKDDTEENWRDLRALGVELAALNLQIVRTIDRQRNMRTTL